MTIKGQVISGEFGNILVRQKQASSIEIGELLVGESNATKVLLQAINLTFGSQVSQLNRELVSGMFLEENQDPTFFESHLRNYTLAQLKTLLTIAHSNTKTAKTLPDFFSTVREVTANDLTFLPTEGLFVGNLRSGSKKIDVPIYLDAKKILSHHVLIPATTGKGKSNLMSVILWNMLPQEDVSMLVFDPHDEYFGKHTLGLSQHPLWSQKGVYFSTANVPSGAYTLSVHISDIKPKHFSGVSDFTEPQFELMQVYYSTYSDSWIEALLTDKKIDHGFHEGTIGVVKRRICRLLDLSVKDEIITSHGVYSTTVGKTTLQDITKYVRAGKTVVIDTSFASGQSELLISSIITNAVFDSYKSARKKGEHVPVVGVVLEEAPRVLGKEILERGSNVFSSIAKEGRKFNVGLCAITQLPSLIPKDILANMNTKIILGLEMAPERAAVIESAAQDLSDDDRNIASLDKGEALITSNFTRFAIPIKIPLLSEIVTQTKIDLGKTKNAVKLSGI